MRAARQAAREAEDRDAEFAELRAAVAEKDDALAAALAKAAELDARSAFLWTAAFSACIPRRLSRGNLDQFTVFILTIILSVY